MAGYMAEAVATPASTSVAAPSAPHEITGGLNPSGRGAEYYLGDNPIDFAEIEAKIKAIKESGEKEIDPNVNLRGDKEICYADVMRLLGRIKSAGFGANIEVIPEQEKR
jgi:biopolymer transport protein ExbD